MITAVIKPDTENDLVLLSVLGKGIRYTTFLACCKAHAGVEASRLEGYQR